MNKSQGRARKIEICDQRYGRTWEFKKAKSMGKETRCSKCNTKIRDEEVFLHDEGKYCPECTLEHVKAKHTSLYRTPT